MGTVTIFSPTSPHRLLRLTDAVLAGHRLQPDEAAALVDAPLFDLLAAADRLRRAYSGDAVELCAIANARSGGCDQDCRFCAQSAHHAADAPRYPFVSVQEVAAGARRALAAGARRYSIVTSGLALAGDEFARALDGIRAISATGAVPCASLGVLDEGALRALRDAGLTRYHHNLEAARGFYPEVCTTRTFDDNLAVLRAARRAGLEVCAGCLFGLGETWAQRIELFLEIRDLDVVSVPINFLIPIPGTPLADREPLSPCDGLRILALARLCLPDRSIRVCGGRANLRSLQPLIFAAGASGLMVGDLLTVEGPNPDDDRRLLADLGLRVSS